MSDKLPVISGKDLVALLEKCGFVIIRIKGSHHRMKHQDGRMATVPVHKNDPVSKGLLRKIIREDILISIDEFSKMVSK